MTDDTEAVETTATQTLTDFLLARIAEDEADAIATMNEQAIEGRSWDARSQRVLAECEAKRRIVDLAIEAQWMREVLIRLAAVYSDHADYREEWRP